MAKHNIPGLPSLDFDIHTTLIRAEHPGTGMVYEDWNPATEDELATRFRKDYDFVEMAHKRVAGDVLPNTPEEVGVIYVPRTHILPLMAMELKTSTGLIIGCENTFPLVERNTRAHDALTALQEAAAAGDLDED